MIYIIDHQDSFTHNVVHQFESFGNVVCDNYNEINENKLNSANVIVLSPGPGAPKNYPISSNIYKKFKGKKKIIGICLGFQQILYCEKGKIIEQNKIYHGYQSQIKVTSSNSLFKKGSAHPPTPYIYIYICICIYGYMHQFWQFWAILPYIDPF